MRRTWPFAFNVLFFAGTAFFGPFIVLYYQSLGFTGAQIGVLTGIAPLITLVCAPLWTGFADATHRHRLLMTVAMVCGSLTIFATPFFNLFAPLLLVAVLGNAFFSPVAAFADSAIMFMLGDAKDMYGRIRLGGTIGYGISASVAGALVQNLGLKVAFWGGAALIFMACFVSQRLVHSTVKAGHLTVAEVRALLTNRRWLVFLTLGFAAGLTLAVNNNYFFPFMKELGAAESTMGLALTIGTISEVPVLLVANRLIRRLKPYGLLILSMVITALRMVLFGVVSAPGVVLFVQLINGLTFVTVWVAGVSYADENAPPGMGATAQGLFGAMVFGVGGAVGGFFGGPLLETIGGRGLYLVSGTVVLVIVAAAAFVQTRLPAEPIRRPRSEVGAGELEGSTIERDDQESR